MMPPTKGTNAMKYHQPLRPVSCSLRTVTASEGINIAREYREMGMKIRKAMALGSEWPNNMTNPTARIANPIPMSMLKSVKYQYSFRLARPSNTAYFLSTSRYQ